MWISCEAAVIGREEREEEVLLVPKQPFMYCMILVFHSGAPQDQAVAWPIGTGTGCPLSVLRETHMFHSVVMTAERFVVGGCKSADDYHLVNAGRVLELAMHLHVYPNT